MEGDATCEATVFEVDKLLPDCWCCLAEIGVMLEPADIEPVYPGFWGKATEILLSYGFSHPKDYVYPFLVLCQDCVNIIKAEIKTPTDPKP